MSVMKKDKNIHHTMDKRGAEEEKSNGGKTKGSSNIISSVEKISEMLRKLTFCFDERVELPPPPPEPINGSEKWFH